MRRALAIALVTTGLACAEHGDPEPTPGSAARPDNLLLITVDTLRADHLGLHGYDRPTSPRLDAFARESLVFEQAQATSSWTLPTLASVLTSTYMSTHGCTRSNSALSPSFDTLATVLAGHGFDTAAIVNHVFLQSRYGLNHGFAEYDEELALDNLSQSHIAVTSPQVSEKAREWLGRRAASDARWFLWVHYFDPHEQYVVHEDLQSSFTSGAHSVSDIDRYDGEIAFTDRAIGALLDTLDELDLARTTAVAFVADHGEEFGEHGKFGHRKQLFTESIRVPLAVRVPGVPARRIREPVSTIDLAPTLLSLLELEPPPGFAGRDLSSSVPAAERPILSELDARDANLAALVRGRWKLILDRTRDRAWLFDLEVDPDERVDLAARQPELERELRDVLAQCVAEAEERGEDAARGDDLELSPADRRQLESLGYGGDGD